MTEVQSIPCSKGTALTSVLSNPPMCELTKLECQYFFPIRLSAYLEKYWTQQRSNLWRATEMRNSLVDWIELRQNKVVIGKSCRLRCQRLDFQLFLSKLFQNAKLFVAGWQRRGVGVNFPFLFEFPASQLLTASPEWSFTQTHCDASSLHPTLKAQLLENRINLLNIVWRIRFEKFSVHLSFVAELKNSGSTQADFRWKHVQAWFSRENSFVFVWKIPARLPYTSTPWKQRPWKVLKLVFPDHVPTKAPISRYSPWSFHAWLDTLNECFRHRCVPWKLPYV